MNEPPSILWPSNQEGADWVVAGREVDELIAHALSFDGQSRRAEWVAADVHVVSGKSTQKSYMPWCNEGTLILRDEAIESVGTILADFGELLPLRCPGAELVAFNALQLTDLIDMDRSRIRRWTSGAVTVESAVFPADVAKLGVFKWSGEPDGPIYLTEPVVARLAATDHTFGTIFPPSDRVLFF